MRQNGPQGHPPSARHRGFIPPARGVRRRSISVNAGADAGQLASPAEEGGPPGARLLPGRRIGRRSPPVAPAGKMASPAVEGGPPGAWLLPGGRIGGARPRSPPQQ